MEIRTKLWKYSVEIRARKSVENELYELRGEERLSDAGVSAEAVVELRLRPCEVGAAVEYSNKSQKLINIRI